MCMPSMPNMGPQWPNYGGQVPENWTGGYVRVPTTTVNEDTGDAHRGVSLMWMDKEGKLWQGPGAGAQQIRLQPTQVGSNQAYKTTKGAPRGKVAEMTPQMAAWLGMKPKAPKQVPEKRPGEGPHEPIDPYKPIRWWTEPEIPGWRQPGPSDIKTGGSAPKSPDEPGKYGMLDQKRAARRKGTRRNVLTLGNPGEVTVVKRVLGA